MAGHLLHRARQQLSLRMRRQVKRKSPRKEPATSPRAKTVAEQATDTPPTSPKLAAQHDKHRSSRPRGSEQLSPVASSRLSPVRQASLGNTPFAHAPLVAMPPLDDADHFAADVTHDSVTSRTVDAAYQLAVAEEEFPVPTHDSVTSRHVASGNDGSPRVAGPVPDSPHSVPSTWDSARLRSSGALDQGRSSRSSQSPSPQSSGGVSPRSGSAQRQDNADSTPAGKAEDAIHATVATHVTHASHEPSTLVLLSKSRQPGSQAAAQPRVVTATRTLPVRTKGRVSPPGQAVQGTAAAAAAPSVPSGLPFTAAVQHAPPVQTGACVASAQPSPPTSPSMGQVQLPAVAVQRLLSMVGSPRPSDDSTALASAQQLLQDAGWYADKRRTCFKYL